MTTQGAVAALIKITRAVERGSVDVDEMHLQRLLSYDYLSIELRPDDPHSVAWFLRAFSPGDKPSSTARTIRALGRGTYFDAWAYTKPMERSTLTVTYWSDHEHYRYEPIEKVLRHGIQVWRCKDCKVRLTTTQARALNLVAPR